MTTLREWGQQASCGDRDFHYKAESICSTTTYRTPDRSHHAMGWSLSIHPKEFTSRTWGLCYFLSLFRFASRINFCPPSRRVVYSFDSACPYIISDDTWTHLIHLLSLDLSSRDSNLSWSWDPWVCWWVSWIMLRGSSTGPYRELAIVSILSINRFRKLYCLWR